MERLVDKIEALLPEAEDDALSQDDTVRIASDLGTSFAAVKRALWMLVNNDTAGVDEFGFYRRTPKGTR